jgi:RimJ/RimL family protein N-acetyltransferase
MRIVLTPRLCLEPQIAAHAVEMFAVLSDPAIYEFENAPPASVEWLRQRFSRLETRRSPDGSEHWLNWVVRLPSSGLVGYVQATVSAGANAAIAYELSSRYWGMGLGREAVGGMIGALVTDHDVETLSAVLKRANHRSRHLLDRLEFAPGSPAQHVRAGVAADELLMTRKARTER